MIDLSQRTILLTGASSGIGRCLATELAGAGARLVLAGRSRQRLEQLQADLGCAQVRIAVHDLEREEPRTLWRQSVQHWGVPDILINNAGVLDFTPVELESGARVEELFRVNVVAPVLLCREAVRDFRTRGSGQIVNIGSIFGSIAFAYFATYSASKFALRGYSEALRRELAGTDVRVTYVAPRATRTRLAELFGSFAQRVQMKMDEPEAVASAVVEALRAGARERYLGFPESLYVRLNALWPRLIDRALARQNQTARAFAEACAANGRET